MPPLKQQRIRGDGGGGGQGAMPSHLPVRNSHRNDGCLTGRLIFHVSCPPLRSFWIRYLLKALLCLILIYVTRLIMKVKCWADGGGQGEGGDRSNVGLTGGGQGEGVTGQMLG